MKNAKRIISVLLSAILLLGNVAIGGVIGSADASLPVPDITYIGLEDPIVISEDKTIELNGVTIEGTDTDPSPITIEPGVTVNIILSGENTLTAKENKNGAGIYVRRDNTDPDNPIDAVLNIYGRKGGKLTVTGGNYGAGIGGVRDGEIGSCTPGIINVRSGEIYAQGGNQGAGIGSTRQSSGNEINIYGGNVTAIAGNSGAGIGTGYGTSGGVSDKVGSYSAGIINITGGTVRAAAGKFKDGYGFDDFDADNADSFFENCYEANGYGAGIGGGYGANGCSITIGGNADVTAIGSCSGAGIGAGRGTSRLAKYDETCTPYDITIKDNAKVVAASPDDTRNNQGSGAGIGGGRGFNDGGSIKILDNADVTAIAEAYAAAIGGSWKVGDVDIENSSLIAKPDILEIAPTASVKTVSDGFTNSIGYPVGSVIQYGTYPQSVVKDADTLAALNAKLSDGGWKSYGYYSGTGSWNDGNMAPSDYMRYQDVVLDGVKYRAVKFDSYRPYSTGYTSSSNQQSSNGYSTDTTYLFRFEPIEWKVLDPDSGLVVCASAIDSQAYNNYILSADGEYWGNAEKTYGANDYANSSIRAWLNNDFINTAFSSSQQENIKVTELDNSCPYDSNFDSETTSDKIFLLSYNEAINSAYGFISDAGLSDTARQRTSSDYAKCQGIYMDSAGNSYWWLRSPYSYSYGACDVNCNGDADDDTLVEDTNIGVVPALKMQNLESDPTGVPVKADPEITLSVPEETQVEGEKLTITVGLPEDATGTVTLAIGDEEGTAAVSGDGTAEIKIAAMPGTHEILVSYSGDDNYNMVSENRIVKIPKYFTSMELEISPEEPVYGNDVTIIAHLPDDATEDVTLTVDGIDYTVPVEDGRAVLTVEKPATGEHTVTASYPGDNSFIEASAEIGFTVNKVTPEMTVTVTPENPVSDGSFTLTVNLPDDAGGNVIIRFNEVDLLGYIQLANGNSQDFNCLQSGTYSGTARYMPDENSNYEEVTVEFSFNVSAAAPNMTLTADDITYGETASVTANLPTDTMWGSVTFYLDAAETGKEVYVSQGKAVCTFGGLNVGEHTVEAVFANDDKYADETKTVTFNVEQKELKITANDQTYPFNNQTQGEGDTTYEDPAEISEKITVEGLVAGDSLASIILDGQAKDIGEYPDSVVPSSAQIKNGNGQDVTANYNITYTAGKLTINSVNAPLTVNYVYENGTTAADSYTDNIEIFTGYSVTSPEITGYTPDKETVEGTMENLDGVTETVTYTANTYKVTYIVDGDELSAMDATFGQSVPKPRTPQKEGYKFAWIDEIPETMPAEDVTINGAFTPIEYTATFVDENGETVEEVPYTVETQSITEPDVPEKQGYFGEWENYTLAIGGVTVKPVYRNITSIELEGYTESSESGYKEDRTFTAKAENLPEGAEIHWFVNGEDVGTGDICTVEDPTDDYTVQAKVIDKDGNTLDETKVQPVKVKNGFFDRLKAFFAELIEKILGKAIADLLGSVC